MDLLAEAYAGIYNEAKSFHPYDIGDFVDGLDGQEVIVNIDQDGTINTREVTDEGNSYTVGDLSQESGKDVSNMSEGDIVEGYDGEEIIVNINEKGIIYTLVLGEGGNKYTKEELDKAQHASNAQLHSRDEDAESIKPNKSRVLKAISDIQSAIAFINQNWDSFSDEEHEAYEGFIAGIDELLRF